MKIPLRIQLECLPVLTAPFSFVGIEHILKDMAKRNVPLAVLIPGYVPSPFCGFRKMIDIFFLAEGKVIPTGNLIPYYIKVRKLFNKILEGLPFFSFLFSA